MTCMTFKPLSCGSLGVGFLSQGNSCNTDTLQLMSGHGARFPTLNANEYFNIILSTPCQTCCTRLRVVATSGDTFTVEGLDTSTCSCFPENSRVSYDTTSEVAAGDLLELRCMMNCLDIANQEYVISSSNLSVHYTQ